MFSWRIYSWAKLQTVNNSTRQIVVMGFFIGLFFRKGYEFTCIARHKLRYAEKLAEKLHDVPEVSDVLVTGLGDDS